MPQENQNDVPKVEITSCDDLVCTIPYLLGFHPQESMIVFAGRSSRGALAARIDLMALSTEIDSFVETICQYKLDEVMLLGYGTEDQVTPAIDAARLSLIIHGLTLRVILRVEGQRYWAYADTEPRWRPPEGVRVDAAANQATASMVYAGETAQPSRDDLFAQLNPVTGAAQANMAVATQEAERRLLPHGRAWAAGPEDQLRVAEGLPAICTFSARARAGKTLTDAETAELGVLLTNLQLRDEAWTRIACDDPGPETLRHQTAFWSDVLRRVHRPYKAAPAVLLAYTAALRGDGGLANIALDHAQEADPSYTAATLLRRVIQLGTPPDEIRAIFAA